MGDDRKGQTYKIQGFAYNGYGTAINRVELTLDGGKTWKYCFKKYLPKPLRYLSTFIVQACINSVLADGAKSIGRGSFGTVVIIDLNASKAD